MIHIIDEYYVDGGANENRIARCRTRLYKK